MHEIYQPQSNSLHRLQPGRLHCKPNDDLSFLSIVQKEGEDYGYTDFVKTIDTVILGRKTYDWVMTQVSEFPHADKTYYIITRTPRPAIEKTTFYTGDLNDLVLQLKKEQGKTYSLMVVLKL